MVTVVTNRFGFGILDRSGYTLVELPVETYKSLILRGTEE